MILKPFNQDHSSSFCTWYAVSFAENISYSFQLLIHPQDTSAGMFGQLCVDDNQLANEFLNGLLNQLNWSFSEFIGMLQEVWFNFLILRLAAYWGAAAWCLVLWSFDLKHIEGLCLKAIFCRHVVCLDRELSNQNTGAAFFSKIIIYYWLYLIYAIFTTILDLYVIS